MGQSIRRALGKDNLQKKQRTIFTLTILSLVFVLSILFSIFISFFIISVFLSLIQPQQKTVIGIAMILVSYFLGIYTYHQYDRLRKTMERKKGIVDDLGKLRFGK